MTETNRLETVLRIARRQLEELEAQVEEKPAEQNTIAPQLETLRVVIRLLTQGLNSAQRNSALPQTGLWEPLPLAAPTFQPAVRVPEQAVSTDGIARPHAGLVDAIVAELPAVLGPLEEDALCDTPDVRDGLKVVQRRVLYALFELLEAGPAERFRSMRVTGAALGRYHASAGRDRYDRDLNPFDSTYEAMVEMAQPWRTRYPLFSVEGNPGSIDGDLPAAPQFTTIVTTPFTREVMAEMNEATEFTANYDETLREPCFWQSSLPLLLLNGSDGTGPRHRTAIPPHNAGELIEAALLMLQRPDVSLPELMRLMPGPDFPTGALAGSVRAISDAYALGCGSIRIRSRAHVERPRRGSEAVIVTEIPYGLWKMEMINKLADTIRRRELDVVDLRDCSTGDEIRIELAVRVSASPEKTLQQLYDTGLLDRVYELDFTTVENGSPVRLTFLQLLDRYIRAQIAMTTRREPRGDVVELVRARLLRLREQYSDSRRTAIVDL